MKCELEKHMQLAHRKSINLHTHRASISDKLPKQHQSAVHFQDKPYRCNICDLEFAQSALKLAKIRIE